MTFCVNDVRKMIEKQDQKIGKAIQWIYNKTEFCPPTKSDFLTHFGSGSQDILHHICIEKSYVIDKPDGKLRLCLNRNQLTKMGIKMRPQQKISLRERLFGVGWFDQNGKYNHSTLNDDVEL